MAEIAHHHPQRDGSSSVLGKPMKRCNKPLMEKRRRERINSSLEQLKSLVLESMRKDTSQYSKLEKADILEMTVKHLRTVQRQQLHLAAAADSSVAGKYRAGFNECAMEVTRYLSQVDGLNPDTRGRLLQHLGACVQQVTSLPVLSHSPPSGLATQQHPGHFRSQQVVPNGTSFATLPGVSSLDLQNNPSLSVQSNHLPGVPTACIQLDQLQQHQHQQQQLELATAAALAQLKSAASAVEGTISPQGEIISPHLNAGHQQQQFRLVNYTGNVHLVPMAPPRASSSDFHHQMSMASSPTSPASSSCSPVSVTNQTPRSFSPEVGVFLLHDSLSHDNQFSQSEKGAIPSTQLKIEIPPSPSPKPIPSSTPILKCASPPTLHSVHVAQDNNNNNTFPHNEKQHHGNQYDPFARQPGILSMEPIWRPW